MYSHNVFLTVYSFFSFLCYSV